MSIKEQHPKIDFLVDLAALIEKHKASFYYTTDDDGIHIELDGELVFIGFLDSEHFHSLLKGKNETEHRKEN